jgi:hypothetical protein
MNVEFGRQRPSMLVVAISAASLSCLMLVACSKKSAKSIECFDVLAGGNSPQTRALFASRHCQGGGVTWAALLEVLARREGVVQPVLDATPGWTGSVNTLNGVMRFSIDEEGDSARFCANDSGLAKRLHAQYDRLNSNEAELSRAMSEASPLNLECLNPAGGLPALPEPVPTPVLPPHLVGQKRAATELIERTIRETPVWCFPPDGIQGVTGALHFLPDGGALHTSTRSGGEELARGSWTLPREGSGDDRVELVFKQRLAPPGRNVAGLYHFDVGPSGNLGFSYATVPPKREELIPGARCP